MQNPGAPPSFWVTDANKEATARTLWSLVCSAVPILVTRSLLIANKKRGFWKWFYTAATVGRVRTKLFIPRLSGVFRISDAVRRTKTEDGAVVMDIRHGRIFCLNAVGSRILDLLTKGFDTAQIASEVSKVYAMDIETVRVDVRDFIDVLNKHHILEGLCDDGIE
jgi:Coenzyme PQQ synthesis protein D (PqqD)